MTKILKIIRIIGTSHLALGMILLCAAVVNLETNAATGRLNSSQSCPSIRFATELSSPSVSLKQALSAIQADNPNLSLELTSAFENRKTGLRVLRYIQTVDGIPIIGAGLTLTGDRSDRMISIYNNILPINKVNPSVWIISALEAIDQACHSCSFSELRGQIETKKVFLPRNGELISCWKVSLPVSGPPADWDLYIDAQTKEVLLKEDRLQRIQGIGQVFLPDPITALHDPNLRDQNDDARAIPEQAYTEVQLPDITRAEDDFFELTGPWVDTSPTRNRARLDTPEFYFNREDDWFEEVMAYYHLDCQARYLETLGWGEILPHSQRIEVNGIEADVSFFSPQTGIITTGTGGVDDAEDADVLIHEYSHAVLQNLLPDWRGGETALLTEGWCDYLAGDYSLSWDDEFQPFFLYNWDGHNEFWQGRVLNSRYTYDQLEGLDAHDAGQMWSALLTEIRLLSPNREEWNRLALTSLTLLGDSATVVDAADALLAADLALNEGQFRRFIIPACESRGIYPAGLNSPQIIHRPLPDTENLADSLEIRAEIHSQIPLDPARTWTIYRFGGNLPDTVALVRLEEPDQFSALIPPPRRETDVHYFILAADTLGVFSTDPPSAPFEWHHFHAGPDRLAPLVSVLDTISETPFRVGERIFSAHVTDNLGVGEVSLIWYRGWMQPGGQIELKPDPADSSLYLGRFQWDMTGVEGILYQVRAADISARRNIGVSGLLSVSLHSEALIENFERPNCRWETDSWERLEGVSQEGDWSWTDRSTEGEVHCLSSEAILNEWWRLSGYGRGRLSFWEMHQFDEHVGAYGIVETIIEGEERPVEVFRIRGNQPWWQRVDITLDEFAGEDSPPVKIRFVTSIPENAEPRRGWFIDNIRLRVGNIVEVDSLSLSPDYQPKLLSIFPQPANAGFIVNYQLNSTGCLRMLDPAGREMQRWPLILGHQQVWIDASAVPTGWYLIEIRDESQNIRRIVKVLR
ncbi:MAG: hypothetical protein V2A61_02230 [Calditrichota bacterium]